MIADILWAVAAILVIEGFLCPIRDIVIALRFPKESDEAKKQTTQ